ncbi:MAG: S1C family serine protease, partial [Gammaproteobacteria bacterium]|nr:S1C family serine protease [Gammaproteobacteria bacterium]
NSCTGKQALAALKINRLLAEAQRLSSNWKVGQGLRREGGAGVDPKPASGGQILTKVGTGTAFLVSKSGMTLTANHVVKGCAAVKAEGREGVFKVVTADPTNDIALLQFPGPVIATAALTKAPESLRQGEEIVVFGFPLNSVLSSGGNLTPGIVSALTGLSNNTNQVQITAPIQPGSSGSAVLNKKGEVVGMVTMKISDSAVAKETGQIPQNVNFATNGQTINAFLAANQVEYRTGGFLAFEKSASKLADEARKWTLVVECWK